MSSKIDHDGKIVVEPAYKRVVRDANACGLNVKEKQSAATKAGDFKCPKCGWLARNADGCAVCTQPAEPASAADGAKPVAWVTPLRYGEQVTFYKPPAPAPGEDDEWYCYPLFRHPAPSACGVADPAAEGCLCHGCGIRYRGDLNIPDDVWAKISNGDNLLCASCIARRIIEAGIWTAIRGEDVDAQSAGTPSEAPVAWAVRVEDGSVGVLGWQDIAKFEHFMTLAKLRDGCSVVYAYESTSRPQPARGEVSEAEIEAAEVSFVETAPKYTHQHDCHPHDIGEPFHFSVPDTSRVRAALEAAARVRATSSGAP